MALKGKGRRRQQRDASNWAYPYCFIVGEGCGGKDCRKCKKFLRYQQVVAKQGPMVILVPTSPA